MDLSIVHAARECGTKTAVVLEEGALTYAELAARVAVVCEELTRRGLDQKSLVAIRASNRWQTLLAILSFLERGIPFVPIHPRWTDKEVAILKEDARPSLVLQDAEVDALTMGQGGQCSAMTTIGQVPPLSAAPSDPLAILFSSGTTGRPKGAILSRAAFIASARGSAENLRWFAEDRWLLCLPLCHIGGLSILTRCLLSRRTIVLLPRYDSQAVLAAIVRHRATLLSVVPTMLHGLLDADGGQALRSLRAVLCGGAATPLPLLERAVQAGVNVLPTYGLTEACSQVTVKKWTPEPSASRGSGVPLSGLLLSIRDETGTPLPAGAAGRILIRGDSLMTGYLGHEPLLGRWFDTGDIGELDAQGVLYVHARRTDLIVTGGENVYPLEVEQALLTLQKSHIRAAIVFGVPDPRWGAVVAAALVVDEGFVASEVEAELKNCLAPFKRPRMWAVVQAIPELPNGKVDRRRAIEEFTPLLRPGRS